MYTTLVAVLECFLVFCGSALYFTSTNTMEDLYNLEMTLIRHVENYLKEEQNRLFLLSSRYEEAVLALSNIVSKECYVANPINTFSLIRRLTKEWPKTLSLLKHEKPKNWNLPTDEEFLGAVRALTRLQEVYMLSAESLADGHLPGTHKRAVLLAADCVAVAQFFYGRHDYQMATDWLQQALNKVYVDSTCPVRLVLENLFLSTCFGGQQDLSTYYLQQLMKAYTFYIPPDNLLSDYNIALRRECKEEAETRKLVKDKIIPELDQEQIDEYHDICRRNDQSPRVLRCYLVHYNHPHLRIGPFKMEEMHLEPPLVMFHEVMSDEEIRYIQHVTSPLMKRAKIVLQNGTKIAANYRTSHIAWLLDNDPVSLRVTRRVAAMTNLDVKYAEPNQVSNYGMAGEYITHLDAFEKVQNGAGGNRMATFMIYMSDVLRGGHTVFLYLKVSVKPKKGSALFWFNLNHDGSVDYRMRHASCPVIVGSKWVLNKWLHEDGQELGKNPPCLRELKATRENFYL